MRKLIPAIILLLLLMLAVSMQTGAAQGTTPTATPSASTSASASSVTIFFVACGDAAVMNLSGNMETGFDVFYQIFSGTGGTGTALSSLRQVQVSGSYAFSERLAYNAGGTVATGATASARVTIGRETNSASTTFDTTVNDIQDGCNNPQHTLGTSVDAGSGAVGPEVVAGQIRSPFGGFINSNFPPTPEPIVVIGARRDPGRSNTPGVLFAECDQNLPEAAPGILYDNDHVVIFWSWFARTEQQIQDHLANAEYAVRLNRAPLQSVNVSPITQPSANFWVFYTADIGNLTPGTYGVEFKLTWKEKISDGYDEFGPGTDNTQFDNSCTFTIQRNPNNQNVTYNQMYSLR